MPMYQELKKIYYSDRQNYETEYFNRLNGYASLKTNLYPRLMKKQDYANQAYPLFVTLLLDIQLLSQRINDQSHTIRDLAEQLPEIAHAQFYQEQLYLSIISTNEIEGVRTTRRELVEASKFQASAGKERPKHLSTLRMYQNILDDDFLHIQSLQDIRSIYDQLTDSEIEAEDAPDDQLFRDGSAIVQDDRTGKVIHIPPHSEEGISRMLESWLVFINDSQVPFLIKAILAHYFFENVHPFYDGNGRTGRYILAKYLSRRLDRFSGLVLSQKINEHKSQYYKAFQITGDYLNRADGTFFVKTLLQLLAEGQEMIIQTLTDKLEHFSAYQKRLDESDDLTDAEKTVLFYLIQSKLFIDDPSDGIEDREIVRLGKQSKASFSQKAIKDALLSLEAKNLIVLINGKPRQHVLTENF